MLRIAIDREDAIVHPKPRALRWPSRRYCLDGHVGGELRLPFDSDADWRGPSRVVQPYPGVENQSHGEDGGGTQQQSSRNGAQAAHAIGRTLSREIIGELLVRGLCRATQQARFLRT